MGVGVAEHTSAGVSQGVIVTLALCFLGYALKDARWKQKVDDNLEGIKGALTIGSHNIETVQDRQIEQDRVCAARHGLNPPAEGRKVTIIEHEQKA